MLLDVAVNLALNGLLGKLDRRIEKKEAGVKRMAGFVRYKRVASHPLSTSTPDNGPSWAISKPHCGR